MADVITRLRVDSREYDNRIKRAAQALTDLETKTRKAGGSLNNLTGEQRKYISALGSMETVSTTVRGRIGELSSAYTELRVHYNRLTDEEKQGVYGKTLSAQLDKIKERIHAAKTELSGISREMDVSAGKTGGFSDALKGLAGNLGISGDIMSVLTTGTVGLTAAVAAAAAAAYKAAQAWAEWNTQLNQQDQTVTVTTGLSGPDAAAMTDSLRALSAVYGSDFRASVDAANTLMTQFGVSGTEAIALLQRGMQGMIQGDAPKLLSMIGSFAPAFQSAGLSASQLVAVIQNTEGGIFTDSNMQAIVYGLKNVRNMTDATAASLTALGVNADAVRQDIADGTISVFQALRLISEAIDANRDKTAEVGAVMQQVFGRQGIMAGDNLGKAIATLNLNLDETSAQTGATGRALDDLTNASVRLNSALREAAGYEDWDSLTTSLKADLTSALASVVESLASVKRTLSDIAGINVWDMLVSGVLNTLGPLGKLVDLARQYFNIVGSTPDAPAAPVPSIPSAASPSRPAAAGMAAANAGAAVLPSAPSRYTLPPTAAAAPASSSAPSAASPSRPAAAEKEVTIRQAIATLEQEALTATVTRREEISAAVRALDMQLERQKEVTAAIHDSNAAIAERGGEEADPLFTPGHIKEFIAPDAAAAAAPAGISVPVTLDTEGMDIPSVFDTVREQMEQAAADLDMGIFSQLLTAAFNSGMTSLEPDFTSIQEAMAAGIDIPDEVWEDLQERINERLEEMNLPALHLDVTGAEDLEKKAKDTEKSFNLATGSVSKLGSALSGLEDPAAKAVGTVIMAVADAAAGFAQASKGPFSNPWEWIAFAISGMATMISMVTSIHSATGLASGGFVPGQSYSGDNVIANGGSLHLDAGELVLNRAQQNNLANALDQPAMSQLSLSATVLGEDIRLALDNNGRRTGRGEYVTSNTRR